MPLIIRGPGVPRGKVSEAVTSHTDLVPTVFEMVGLRPHGDFDGESVPLRGAELLEVAERKRERKEHVGVEYWGWAVSEGKFGREMHWNNTYKSLRVVGEGYNFYYSVWCDNAHELYDLEVKFSSAVFFLFFFFFPGVAVHGVCVCVVVCSWLSLGPLSCPGDCDC